MMLDRLLEVLASGGERVVFEAGEVRLTYAECAEKVERLAGALAVQGQGPVLVYGKKDAETFLSILACVVAQRCYVPLDPTLPQARLEYIARQAHASLAIAHTPLVLKSVCCLSSEEICARWHGTVPAQAADPAAVAYVIFISGSTGMSKGVPISRGNLEAFIRWITAHPALCDWKGARILGTARFGFDLSVMDLYFTLFTQGTLLAPTADVRKALGEFYEELARKQVEVIVLTPTLAKLLLLEPSFDAEHFPALRGLFFCGECLEVGTVRKLRARFPMLRVINAYGPSECTCCVSLVAVTDGMLAASELPVGVLEEAAVRVRLEDEEIVLEGASVFTGYLGRAPLVGAYHTGDLGAIKNGLLYCHGRRDQQIKYQGYRIELGEIEAHLQALPGVVQAVCLAKRVKGTTVVKLIKAFVVAAQNVPQDARQIKEALARTLPGYMIPKTIVFVDTLPVTTNGKIDRKKLMEQ